MKVRRSTRKRIGREDDGRIVRADDRRSSAPAMTPRRLGPSVLRDPRKETHMTAIERSIVIDRPIEDVFAFVHDPTKDTTWQTTLVDAQPLSEAPTRPGAKVREVRRFLGLRVESTRELTDYAPPRTSSFRMASGPVPYSGGYVLEPVGDATKLTAKGTIDGHGFFKVGEPVFRRMVARELEASLGHLKDVLEAGV
jgi:hypothetical protein